MGAVVFDSKELTGAHRLRPICGWLVLGARTWRCCATRRRRSRRWATRMTRSPTAGPGPTPPYTRARPPPRSGPSLPQTVNYPVKTEAKPSGGLCLAPVGLSRGHRSCPKTGALADPEDRLCKVSNYQRCRIQDTGCKRPSRLRLSRYQSPAAITRSAIWSPLRL